MHTRNTIIPAVALLLSTTAPAMAADSELETALISGKPSVNLRLRLEQAEQDNAAEDATALTLRSRLGYRTGAWHGLSLFGEFESVAAFGGQQYAPETPGHTVIADPTGEEINQAYIRYSGIKKTTFTLGRQRLVIGNSRQLGNVGWRQNEQTFDALSMRTTRFNRLDLTTVIFDDSHFIFFNDLPLEGAMINAKFALSSKVSLTGYALWLDFDTANANDSQTVGLRLDGHASLNKNAKFLFTFEAAQQSDFSDYAVADGEFSEPYYLIDLGVNYQSFTFRLAHEVLASDNGTDAVHFPLATNHKFNGWADVFLFTPDTGLQDSNISLSYKHSGYVFKAVYHDFQADFGDADYGSEINLLVAKKVSKRLKFTLKYADYSADQFAVDTQRLFLQADYSF